MKSSRTSLPEDRTQMMELVWLGLITLLPLVPLFVPDGCFGPDWMSHLWLTSYYSEYFKHHFSFPEVIHTTQLAGMPYPAFYGVLLYPSLGVPGALVGAAWAMRGAVATAFFLQSWQVFRLTFQVGRNRTLGLVVAAVTAWSTYALTNLYNRGAFAELIAVALLTAAIGALGRVFLLPPGKRRASDVASGLLCFVLAAGAHSITALCGGLFIAFLAAVFFLLAEKRSELARWGVLGSMAVVLVLSPWIYVVAKFGSAVLVSKVDSTALSYLEVDSAGSRLMPFPYDSRMAEYPGLPLEQTPHLDAQISTGLLLLALFFSGVAGVLRWRQVQVSRPGVRIMLIFWALFLFLFTVSVTPALGVAMPLFRSIQFAYRLVSYLNLCLLVVVIGGLAALSTAGWADRLRKWWQPVLFFTLAIALLGLVIKLRHGAERAYVTADMSGARVVQMPRGFLGWYGYALITQPGTPDTSHAMLNVPVDSESDFGEVHSVRVALAAAGPVEIRVQPFPWSEVRVDGHPVMTAPGTVQRAGGIIVPMAAGEHEIEYAWSPDPLWRWLNRISRTTLFLWVALVLGFALRKAPTVRWIRRHPGPDHF